MEHYTSVETITKCFTNCEIFPDAACEQEDSADDLDVDIPLFMHKLSP